MFTATTLSDDSSSHAVSRSAELLSCAKTAVKIAQQQHPGQDGWWSTTTYLSLHSGITTSYPQLEEGLSLLRTMDVELQQLESLVRRRGHTNDPTELIALSVKRLETDAQELAALIQKMMPVHARGQLHKHWQCIQQWFQSTAQQQGTRLKNILKIRATVLAEQELRRQRFSVSAVKPTTFNHTSPLFMDSPVRPPQQNANATAQTSAQNGAHRTYGGAPSYYGGPRPTGYGGGYGSQSNTPYYQGPHHSVGMRQRRGLQHDTQQQETQQEQMMLQQRLQQRQTNQRLQEARQAERSLAELGTLFGKMSSLITQQSEVLDKVEDDVEAAYHDVTAGQQEIVILQALKKGNRALIIKVFALLIFFIIFMRVYKGK